MGSERSGATVGLCDAVRIVDGSWVHGASIDSLALCGLAKAAIRPVRRVSSGRCSLSISGNVPVNSGGSSSNFFCSGARRMQKFHKSWANGQVQYSRIDSYLHVGLMEAED
jgi:hypothetical protein